MGSDTYRQLAHLEEEQVPPELLEDAPHDQLVDAGGEEEGYERRGVLVDLHRRDGAVVDVAEEEDVDRPGRGWSADWQICLASR